MTPPLLEVRALSARYGDFEALRGVDLEVGPGEMVALIGANGAGKTTLLRAICGLLRAAPGSVLWEGAAIGGLPPDRVVRRGIAMVPEGRKLFPSLTVEENLSLGAHAGRPGPWDLARVCALFPVLGERRRAAVTALSGGQQQMVAIGRALMANPRLLLCDEISLGLAPLVVRAVYAALPAVRAEGASLVVVEQDVGRVLRLADRAYCLREGRVALSGRCGALSRDAVRLAYFGM